MIRAKLELMTGLTKHWKRRSVEPGNKRNIALRTANVQLFCRFSSFQLQGAREPGSVEDRSPEAQVFLGVNSSPVERMVGPVGHV